ncbi:MAG TPA: hypothetical protein VGO07_01970 [Candidatus Saccharimonadales bacterium]|nr:hypothetical protein [Candidatus Saccharimonadales bacterium]
MPRFLRTARLSYLPTHSIIGSRYIKGADGGNLIFDIVMLPVEQFQRMRSNVGLQHVAAPALKLGPQLAPSFVLADAKEVIVPCDEPDPENFAKNYFMKAFGLITLSEPAFQNLGNETSHEQDKLPFLISAKECTSEE